MKKIVFLILSVMVPYFGIAGDRISVLSNLLRNPESDYVFVIAHRGDWRNAPENSISAIKRAADIGADIVEIDIRKTKDGNFVLMHDASIDRTTDGHGNVSDFTIEELKRFKLKNSDGTLSDEKIPLLKDALLACKGKIMVNIDKGGDYLEQILPIIEETETKDHVILKGSGTLSFVRSVSGLTDFIYMPVFDLNNSSATDNFDSFLLDFQPLAVEVIFNNTENIRVSDYTRRITDSGARVWINSLWESLCGGCSDDKALTDPENNWGHLLEYGANMIQTDRLPELIHYLQTKGRRNL